MDIIAKARELGALLQQDDRYLEFIKCTKANEGDEELNTLIQKLQFTQVSYQHEGAKETPNQEVLSSLENDFNDLYGKITANQNMVNYENARNEIDKLMNYINAILTLCLQGEDPATCEPHEEHDCGGDCSCCSGCH